MVSLLADNKHHINIVLNMSDILACDILLLVENTEKIDY